MQPNNLRGIGRMTQPRPMGQGQMPQMPQLPGQAPMGMPPAFGGGMPPMAQGRPPMPFGAGAPPMPGGMGAPMGGPPPAPMGPSFGRAMTPEEMEVQRQRMMQRGG